MAPWWPAPTRPGAASPDVLVESHCLRVDVAPGQEGQEVQGRSDGRRHPDLHGSVTLADLEVGARRSDPPTHPELLDWLARRFVTDGWSVKRLHKQIMLSATYQQSSAVSEAVLRFLNRP